MTCHWESCGKALKNFIRVHMTRHVLVHIPLRPFKCEFCLRSFNQNEHGKTHVKRFHANELAALDRRLGQAGTDRIPNRPSRPPLTTTSNGEHGRWKQLMHPDSVVHMRNSLLVFGRKMRDPQYNITDRQGIKIVLRTLKKSRLLGAKALRRHLKKLKAGGNLTWKGLMQEFD
jgi:hypothetical protein